MSVDLGDEILQDFLVEAGEILEMLSVELVELEQSPGDMELINSIFRGFHTVKGGAGFLALHDLVAISHKTEDVFNLIRQGQRIVDANLMDVILRSLDVVEHMFDAIREGEDPQPADDMLLQELAILAVPEESQPDEVGSAAQIVPGASEAVASTDEPSHARNDDTEVADENITEQEFDQLLDKLHGVGQHAQLKVSPPEPTAQADPPPAPSAGNADITEEEFENLLDQLHGKGKHTRLASSPPEPITQADPPPDDRAVGDNITDEEFQNLLDDIHGVGRGPTHGKDPVAQPAAPTGGVVGPTGDDITDDEFQSLLDNIHGVGKGPTKAQEPASQAGAGKQGLHPWSNPHATEHTSGRISPLPLPSAACGSIE